MLPLTAKLRLNASRLLSRPVTMLADVDDYNCMLMELSKR